MYVKYIDENTIEKAPKYLLDDKNMYANPLPETLVKFGYKPLVEVACPNEEGYTYTPEYNETEEQVTKTWVAHEIVIEPEPEIIPEPEVIEENESEKTDEVATNLEETSQDVPETTEEENTEEPIVE